MYAFVCSVADTQRCDRKMMDGNGNGNGNAKRLKVTHGKPRVPHNYLRYANFPLSPYRLFMESFMRGCDSKNYMETDRAGFEKWISMTNEEKQPYTFHAKILDYNYQQALDMEEKQILKVQDEAESPMVRKIDKDLESNNSNRIESSSDSDAG